MNGNVQSRIDGIIQNGYDFKFGDYIGKGFDLLQKNLGGFILYALVTLVMIMVISFIPFLGNFANELVISPCMTAGAYLVAHQYARGESAEFGDFFKGFNYVSQLALVALVSGLIILASLIPFFFAANGHELVSWYLDLMKNPAAIEQLGEPPVPPAWTFLLTLPAIYLAIAYSWAPLFVIFYNYSFWDAIETSRKLITKKWGIVFLFTIVIGIIAAAGVILLCIGLLATFPAMLCMTYSAFADVTQLGKEPEAGENIERHLVE
jgi:hypothetical protein